VIRHSPDSARILEILATPRDGKTPTDVAFIFDEMKRCGSIEHGWDVAHTQAARAKELFQACDFLADTTPLEPDEDWTCEYVDGRFLRELVDYVIYRTV
jgi:geranylgeranyl diphosphate synthase type II